MRAAVFILLVLTCANVSAQTNVFVEAPAASAGGTPAVPGTNQITPATPASLNGYVADDKYKLRIGDRISFQILEDRDAPRSLVLADSGELDFTCIGRVGAVEMMCTQLAEEVRALLTNDYYYRATVIIALDAANKVLGRVYIWGQVRNQGPLELIANDNLTVG